MNRRFGKLNEAGNITYAPNVLAVGGRILISPPDEAFLAAGWCKVTDNAPTPTEGFYARPTGWALIEGEIVRQYEQIAVEPTPKVYNKYRLGMAIQEAGLLDALLQFFASNPAAKFHWNNAQEFEENDENFVEICNQFVDSFGEDAVSAILKAAEVA